MRRWTAFQGEPKPTPNPATTEDPTNSSLRCGKWLLRSTKIRRSRGDKTFEGKPPGSQPLKRKRNSPSPTSSANSCIGENNVQLATMDRTKVDVDMWSYANEEIFLKILLEEASKEQSVNTRKTRTFNQHQWTSIHKEFTRQVPRTGYSITKMQQKFERLKGPYRLFRNLVKAHTGLGWDSELKTVTAPDGVWDEIIKANSKNEKLRSKGIDHFELSDELLHNSMATGAFVQPGTLGAATSDEERAMFGPPKSIRGDDSMYSDSRKRKFDGSGGSVAKQVRGEQMRAYESVALANERKAGYYEALTINRQQFVTPPVTIKDTIAALDEIQGIVGDTQYWKAYRLMMGPEGPSWREGFMNHQSHNRIAWVSQLN
ncbi:hypothetical protein RHGRI_032456 [Rhododendron griersonianum]|uniref:Myb/SANT-like domain-containing protein n=1 Tax=Rhododendron griersonianum TaxID=479676 RepID=A0AAV6IBV3_9ERIC|nr:hypothetical protein RHGRI_032456 [Rhododendron griersonianum]